MAELFLQISVSLDGYIEDRNRDIAWMTIEQAKLMNALPKYVLGLPTPTASSRARR